MSDPIPLIQNGNSYHLDVALMHAQAGIYVFPCNGTKKPCTKNGFKDAAIDEFTIRRWWKSNPDAIVGISCGASGLIVIDCDIDDGPNGIASFQEIAVKCGFNPWECPSTVTPSGGAHCYFALRPGFEHGCGMGDLPPNIHVRGVGGYVIAAGCVSDDGRYLHMPGTPDLAAAYRAGAIPILPTALHARLTAPKPKNGPPGGARPAAPLGPGGAHAGL